MSEIKFRILQKDEYVFAVEQLFDGKWVSTYDNYAITFYATLEDAKKGMQRIIAKAGKAHEDSKIYPKIVDEVTIILK